MTMRPAIFRGLWCPCGDRHYQEAQYYVSIKSDNQALLALGPFGEHPDALAHVEGVEREVAAHWQHDARSPWYAYGTAVVKYPPFPLGVLNDALNFH